MAIYVTYDLMQESSPEKIIPDHRSPPSDAANVQVH